MNPIGPPETSSWIEQGFATACCPIDWQRGTRRSSRFHTSPSLFSTIGARASIHGRAWWNPLPSCRIRPVKWRPSSPPAGTVARRFSSTRNWRPLEWLVPRSSLLPRSSRTARTRWLSKQESVPGAATWSSLIRTQRTGACSLTARRRACCGPTVCFEECGWRRDDIPFYSHFARARSLSEWRSRQSRLS